MIIRQNEPSKATINEALFVNALDIKFDEQFHCDVSFLETLRSYYTIRPYGEEIEHATGIIKKYRFAYYAKSHIEKAHIAAWEAHQWPNQVVVEFYFNCFVTMCRACLDCVAHWLNDVFRLGIPNPLDIDLNKDKFRKHFRQRSLELFQELETYKGWISQVSKYREIIVHRGNIISLTVAAGPPEVVQPEHWCSVIADPTKRVANLQWIKGQQASGKFPFVPINSLCDNYAGNLTSVVRTTILHGLSELKGRQK